MSHPVTPDGRYFVVRGRLWRCSDPHLKSEERDALTRELMSARREKGRAMREGDAQGLDADDRQHQEQDSQGQGLERPSPARGSLGRLEPSFGR